MADDIESYLAESQQQLQTEIVSAVSAAATGNIKAISKFDSTAPKLAEIQAKIQEKDWGRPFAALVLMGSEQREHIRKTLDFSWDKDTTLATTNHMWRAQFEAGEIIDCDVRGVVGRMHTMIEQINPARYLSWRQALMRTLDLCDRSYIATDSDAKLEAAVLSALNDGKRKRNREQTRMPTALGKLHKKAGLVMEIIKDAAHAWDDLVGSEEKQAISVIHAICEYIDSDSRQPATT